MLARSLCACIFLTMAIGLSPCLSFRSEPPSSQGDSSALEIKIAKNEMFGYQIRSGPKLPLSIVIRNISSKPIRLWESWNGWGYYNVKLEFVDKARAEHVSEMKPIAFTVNYPSFVELNPGEVLVREVDLLSFCVKDKNGMPHDFPLPKRGVCGDPFSMRAVLCNHEYYDGFAKQYGVWTGEIKTSWQTVSIERW